MKKLINGSQISINIDFFSDYLYGKELKKITLSNIHDNLDFTKSISKTIEAYRNIYDNLHPIMQTIENVQKYCIIGEMLGIPYKVQDGLYVESKDNNILCFRGENWSLTEKKPKGGITWKDCKTLPNYQIYSQYLKTQGKNFIKNCFPELWEAIDENENKLYKELDDILHFQDIKPTEIENNTILDLDLNVQYKIIPSYSGGSRTNKSNGLIIDLDSSDVKINENKTIDTYNFSVYKQELIEGVSGKKDFGKEVKESSLFQDIFFTLNNNKCNEVKGIKLNNVVYYQCGKDVYSSNNGTSTRIIKSGEIYGSKMKKLLVSHIKTLEQGIKKQTIYLLKDNLLDIVSIDFINDKGL